MMSSTIKKHPLFPFIEIGRLVDFAHRDGYADDPRFIAHPDEWTFRIQGAHISYICRSEQDARLQAERTLFLHSPDLTEHYLQTARHDQDLELMTRLANACGYWKGRSEERATLNRHVTAAIKLLQRTGGNY